MRNETKSAKTTKRILLGKGDGQSNKICWKSQKDS